MRWLRPERAAAISERGSDSLLIPGGAVTRARGRDRKRILEFVSKRGIRGLRSAERGFLRNVIELHHFFDQRILSRKIMRNGAARYPFIPRDAGHTGGVDDRGARHT